MKKISCLILILFMTGCGSQSHKSSNQAYVRSEQKSIVKQQTEEQKNDKTITECLATQLNRNINFYIDGNKVKQTVKNLNSTVLTYTVDLKLNTKSIFQFDSSTKENIEITDKNCSTKIIESDLYVWTLLDSSIVESKCLEVNFNKTGSYSFNWAYSYDDYEFSGVDCSPRIVGRETKKYIINVNVKE